MKLKVFPVHYEGYMDEMSDVCVFTVKCFDEVCSEIEIKSPLNVEAWDSVSTEIRKCLVAIHGEKKDDER